MTELISTDITDPTQGVAHLIEALREDLGKDAEHSRTLPPQTYYSPAFFALEQAKVFRADWMCIGHVAQLANVGDYFSIDILGEPLLAVRSAEGIAVMSRVCLHRWMPIVEGAGNARGFACPFHHWSYGLDGQMLGAPSMEQAAGFDAKALRLPRVRSEVVSGLIFITFSDAVASIGDRLHDLVPLLGKYHLADLGVAFTLDYDCDFNWKIAAETFMECYHHSAVHRGTLEHSFPGRLSSIGEGGEGWSICQQPLRAKGELSEILTPGLVPFEGLSEADMRRINLVQIFPNCLLGLDPDRVSVTTLLPISAELTVWHRVVLVSPAAMAQPDFADTCARMQARGKTIAGEDVAVNGIQQRALHSAYAGPGRLSHLERTVWQQANYLRSRLLD
ncbi:aromatic ring-hydroxylating oxygenase subunit alpha [Pseudomonas typographi]|uniref:aromatic ring-hydroxylating oxygenase subunit alpha n=1 Tax=Pseudomonas typographi TaxID=2715964 RepID=UPI001683BD15|nr:aromatic ring-hydroxylating dioxygenase subunit alpha [Pseudomonas typographi]MBD1554730.1 aromatic ring-hydroxylating dioxygenase subunit alpha [Pseudomonas typographi]MBD1589106.1 aromatic ring-hydroxylating dioxygenase subunit alpha [Pseudomonas typographi]